MLDRVVSEKVIRNGYREEYSVTSVTIDPVGGEITEYREYQKMALSDILDYWGGAGFATVHAYRDFDRTAATAEAFGLFVCRP